MSNLCPSCHQPRELAYCCDCVEESPWEHRALPGRRCAICSARPTAYVEDRPTGEGGRLQRWRYCLRCGQELIALREIEVQMDSGGLASVLSDSFNCIYRR